MENNFTETDIVVIDDVICQYGIAKLLVMLSDTEPDLRYATSEEINRFHNRPKK
jgi:hypothetical protein